MGLKSIINSYEISKSIDQSSAIREAGKKHGFLVGFECTNGLSEKGPKNYRYKVKQAEIAKKYLSSKYSDIDSKVGLIMVNSQIPIDSINTSVQYLIKLFTNNQCVLEEVFSALEPRIEEMLNQTRDKSICEQKNPLVKVLKKYYGNNSKSYQEITEEISKERKYTKQFQWLYSHFKGEFVEMYVAELFRHKIQSNINSFLRVGYFDGDLFDDTNIFSKDRDCPINQNLSRRRDLDVVIACNYDDYRKALEKIGKSRSTVFYVNQ